MSEDVYKIPILAVVVAALILVSNTFYKNYVDKADINSEKYNAVEINGETFYEKYVLEPMNL